MSVETMYFLPAGVGIGEVLQVSAIALGLATLSDIEGRPYVKTDTVVTFHPQTYPDLTQGYFHRPGGIAIQNFSIGHNRWFNHTPGWTSLRLYGARGETVALAYALMQTFGGVMQAADNIEAYAQLNNPPSVLNLDTDRGYEMWGKRLRRARKLSRRALTIGEGWLARRGVHVIKAEYLDADPDPFDPNPLGN